MLHTWRVRVEDRETGALFAVKIDAQNGWEAERRCLNSCTNPSRWNVLNVRSVQPGRPPVAHEVAR